jgi:tripartite-type tricarboxylate transporter receptor subunit TctC
VAPEVPTVAQSGFPHFETVTWFGMMAPSGVPEYVVAKLHPEIAKVLRRAEVQKELASQGASATLDNGPDEFAAYLKSQTEKLAKVIKTLGVKAP